MTMKFLCRIHKSIRKQRNFKFTELEYLKHRSRKVTFLNLGFLCRYARFSQAQSQINKYTLQYKLLMTTQ